MRKNSGWILLAALAFGGCTKQSPSVYVDLQVVQASEILPVAPQPVKENAPRLLRTTGISLPPLAEEVILGESAASVKAADQLVRQNRIKAYRDLEARLREVYIGDVARAEKDQMDLLEPARTEAAEAARTRLREIFEEYADQRGPLVTRIALIAGFPDPDPNSKRQPVSDSPLIQQRAEEAKQLRTQIADLEKTYNDTVTELLRNVDRESDIELTRIKASMELARNKAEQRAREDAAKQARSIEKSVGPSLAFEGDTVLPAVAGQNMPSKIIASKPLQPQVSPLSIPDTEVIRMQRLQDELDIWLAINGYRQAESREKASDRTSEFIEWRKSHHLGP